MPLFRYTAYSADGVREESTLDVPTEAQAWDKLISMGLTIVELELETKRESRGWVFGGNAAHIPLGAQAELADQLAVLFAARLSAMQVCDAVATVASHPAIRRKFRRICQLMADGQNFPTALSTVGQGLHALFASLAQIGETSGDFAPLMSSLATTLRRHHKLSAQVRSALIYPVILMVGGLAILVYMALFLAPRLSTIFTSVEKPVPDELAVFIAIGEILSDWWPVLLSAVFCLGIVGPWLFWKYRPQVTEFLYVMPVFGSIVRNASLARLTRALQMTVSGGTPLATALKSVAAALMPDPLARHFLHAGEMIEEGGKASEVFEATNALPSLFKTLFSIGERSNSLPKVLAAIASSLEDQTEMAVQRATALLTPVLILVIGGGIATLVAAVMNALLSVNDIAF